MYRQADDQTLDRPRARPRGNRSGRYDDRSRPTAKPSYRDNPRDLDKDWVHDRYEDDRYTARDTPSTRGPRFEPDDRLDFRDESLVPESGARLRVDNLHYDLTEQDLRELFTRIGPVRTVSILYDRSDRSRGTAFVTYTSARDADDAIREFDGANAYGQPIKLTLMPSGPGARSLASRVEPTSRSLFDRIENSRPPPAGPRARSQSPSRDRRSEVLREGTPDGIDRYVPGTSRPRQARSRSPISSRSRRPPPRNAARSGTRRDDRRGAGRGRGGTARDTDGRQMVGGRPKKTAQELDAEMEDYWGSGSTSTATTAIPSAQQPSSTNLQVGIANADVNDGAFQSTAAAAPPSAAANADDDIDMIE